MSIESLIHSLFDLIILFLAPLVISVIKDISSIKTDIVWLMKISDADRITKDLMNKSHSPDDHLGMDKLVDMYNANNCDLPMSGWKEVEETALSNAKNESLPLDVRNCQKMLAWIAKHKQSPRSIAILSTRLQDVSQLGTTTQHGRN
jgi:hypothetical protein